MDFNELIEELGEGFSLSKDDSRKLQDLKSYWNTPRKGTYYDYIDLLDDDFLKKHNISPENPMGDRKTDYNNNFEFFL